MEQCLCSLQEATKNIETEILVIDNNSSDGSIEYLRSRFSETIFIANKKNIGFAKANNEALKIAKGEFILFLNPDTIVSENALIKCIDFFSNHSNAGAASVRMIDGSGNFLPESKRSFPSPLVSFYKLSGLSTIFPSSKIFNKYSLGFLDKNKIHEVDVLSGAFFFTRKKILNDYGSFDEEFFMYGEDIDLSYRIQKSGFKNYYLGDISIIHFKGESTKKNSLNYVRMFYKAMSLFVKKHYSGNGAWLMNVGLQIAIFFRAAVSMIASPFVFIIHLIKRKIKIKSKSKMIFIGDENAVKQAQQIVSAKSSSAVFKFYFNFEDLNFDKLNCEELIFCIGQLTYTEAISLLQKTPKGINVKWFGINSKSIAGSSSRGFQGNAYYF